MQLLAMIAVGCLSGWMVGVLTRGRGFGIIGNILVGIAGSIAGSFLFALAGIVAVTWVGNVVRSVAGALALLFVVNLLKPGEKT